MAKSAVNDYVGSATNRSADQAQKKFSNWRDQFAQFAPPSEYLPRLRWMLLLSSLVVALCLVFMIAFLSPQAWPLKTLSSLALLTICAWWLNGYRQGVFALVGFLVEGMALMVVAVGLNGTMPLALFALTYLALLFRSLYGGKRELGLLVFSFVVAYVGAGIISAGSLTALILVQIPLHIVALLALALTVRFLSSGLVGRDSVLAREQILSRVSAKLLGATNREDIYSATVEAAIDIWQPLGLVRVGLAIGELKQMAIVASRRAALNGYDSWVNLHHLPAQMVKSIDDCQTTEITDTARLSQSLAPFIPPSGRLYLVPLRIKGHTDGLIIIGTNNPISDDIRRGMETLASLVGLALEKSALLEDQHMQETEERFISLVQNSSDIITIVEADGTIRYQSRSVERVLGHREDELIGTLISALVHPEDQSKLSEFFTDILRKPGRSIGIECRFRQWDGTWRHIETVGTNLLQDNAVQGLLLNSRDVTERHALEGQLAQLAFHDPLTDLPNRVLFMDRLQHALTRAERSKTMLGLLFLDLDNFKVVNDSLGHHAGDQLLKVVATRLGAVLRAEDTAARFGGDEFTVLVEDIAEWGSMAAVAERIQETLKEPVTLSGRDIYVTTSIGIAMSTPGDDRPDSIMRNADAAMYAAKNKGKAGYAVFDPDMNSRMMERLNLQAELRHALERGEFRVFYQPIVEIQSGKIVEAEALVRWEHPQRGLVSPAQFIPMAEEMGLIVALGLWVLEESTRQIKSWQQQLPNQPLLTIGVNLSAKQFQQATLVQDIDAVIKKVGLAPRQLKLEITETLAMGDPEATRAMLAGLKGLGVQLAIDDFGTGYSSLSYLKRYPVDTLKIDRSFVDGLGNNPEDTAIVQTIIAVAKTFGLKVTAEGIETNAQMKQLRALNCDLGQGYYFSRPMSSQDFGLLLVNAARQGLVHNINDTTRLFERDVEKPAIAVAR